MLGISGFDFRLSSSNFLKPFFWQLISLQVSPFLKHQTKKCVKIAMDEPSEKWVCKMYLRAKNRKITIHGIIFLSMKCDFYCGLVGCM